MRCRGALGKHLSAIEAGCLGLETDYVRIRTDDDLGRVLSEYLRKRAGG